MTIELLVRLAVCFLLGSIPFAVLAMAGTGIDIRKIGSGNPGFNNVLRVSKTRAILTLIGDMGKGSLAVWLCLRPEDTTLMGWVYGFATVVGHCYTPWLQFQGGKGIATSGGVMLVLYPKWALVALAFFAAVRIAGSKKKWKEAGAIASIGSWVVFSALMLVVVGRQEAGAAALLTLFLGWRHQQNFRNLLAGLLMLVVMSAPGVRAAEHAAIPQMGEKIRGIVEAGAAATGGVRGEKGLMRSTKGCLDGEDRRDRAPGLTWRGMDSGGPSP